MLRNRFNAVLASGAVLIALALTFSPGARAEEAQPPAPAETTVPAAPADAAKPGEAAEAAKPAAVAPLPDMVMGKDDAPVTIIEYSSLSCPHCATFHKDVFPELNTKYIGTGKVRYILREFPLNESALAGTVIARCLEPSRYFAFIHLLFQKQADWAFKEDALTPAQGLRQAGRTVRGRIQQVHRQRGLAEGNPRHPRRGTKEGRKRYPKLLSQWYDPEGRADLASLGRGDEAVLER